MSVNPVMLELEDLAGKVAKATDVATATEETLANAKATNDIAWLRQDELARQLFAQMRANSIKPCCFALAGYAFTPDGDTFTLTPQPQTMADALGVTP